MKCPYNIPLKATYSKLSDAWFVESDKGYVLFFDLTEQGAKYLVQAINSHEKHEKLELLKQGSIKFQCDKCHEWLTVTVQEIIGSDIKLEQALQEKP